MSYRLIILTFWLVMPALVAAQELTSIDSLRNKADEKFVRPARQVLDSIGAKKNALIDKADRINERGKQYLDGAGAVAANPLNSLDTLGKIDAFKDRLEAAKKLMAKKIDSLAQLGLPHAKYTVLLDSLHRIDPAAQLQAAEDRISQTRSSLEGMVDQPVEKVSEKLGMLRKEAGGEGNLPGDIKITAPGASHNTLTGASLKADGLPSADPVDLAGQLSPDKVDPQGKLNAQLPKLETGKIQEGLSEASNVSEKISGYTEDVRNIGAGNIDQVSQIDKDIVNKIEVEEIQVLNQNTALLEEKKNQVRSLENQEQFKKATLARARQIAATQLAAQQSRIAETLGKISDHQKRAGSLFAKAKNLPKRPGREKKPPVIERFVPGMTLQVQKTNAWFVDLNPTLRYRFRSIFSAGAGWNERIVFDREFNFSRESRMYGIRSFYELSVRKGLWCRADVERMNAFVPLSRSQQDVGERRYVWGYMAGIKKDFSFAPGVMGNVQFMYNLHDPKRTSPYFSRFNVRFGFEFPLKKTSKASFPPKAG